MKYPSLKISRDGYEMWPGARTAFFASLERTIGRKAPKEGKGESMSKGGDMGYGEASERSTPGDGPSSGCEGPENGDRPQERSRKSAECDRTSTRKCVALEDLGGAFSQARSLKATSFSNHVNNTSVVICLFP